MELNVYNIFDGIRAILGVSKKSGHKVTLSSGDIKGMIERKRQKNLKQKYKSVIKGFETFLDADGRQTNLEECSLMRDIIDNTLCPDCGEWDMYDGPSGGGSINIVCGNCGGEFNHCAGFTTQRIHVPEESIRPTPEKIRTYFDFDFFHDHEKRLKTDQAIAWCKNNVKGDWAANRFHIYIENEDDAMAFKLTWE